MSVHRFKHVHGYVNIPLFVNTTEAYPSAYAARNFHGIVLRRDRNFLGAMVLDSFRKALPSRRVRLRYQNHVHLSLTAERFGISPLAIKPEGCTSDGADKTFPVAVLPSADRSLVAVPIPWGIPHSLTSGNLAGSYDF
jgi:hypothetical protein